MEIYTQDLWSLSGRSYLVVLEPAPDMSTIAIMGAKPVQLASVVPMAARLNYLVAGYSKTTEFYLRAVSEIAADRIQIVGVLGHLATKSGRIFHGIPVVGV